MESSGTKSGLFRSALRRMTRLVTLYRASRCARSRENKSTDTSQEFHGYFWVRGRDSNRQVGGLQVAPGVAPTVGTVSPLLSPWNEVRRTQQPDGPTVVTSNFEEAALLTPVTIHGLDSQGTPLTLLSATTTYWGPPDSAGHGHIFRGLQAMVGIHVQDRDRPFTGFRVRLRNLEAWRSCLQQAQWITEVTLADGGTVTMQDLPVPGCADRSALWLTLQGVPPSTLRSLESHYIQPLISLFTLAADRACAPTALQVQEGSPDGPWRDVYSAALQADDATADLRSDIPRWLLQPSDLGLHQVGAWLDHW